MVDRNNPSPLDADQEGDSTEHLRSLADAIAQTRAVVYVGAGVSTSSGLPTWGEDIELI